MVNLDRKLFLLLMNEALKSGCMYRKYAAAVVKNDIILSLGYARTVNDEKCEDIGTCPRENMRLLHSTSAEFFEVCRVVHAEMDAILKCKKTTELKGSTLYLLGLIALDKNIYKNAFPCGNCLKCIKLVGIKQLNIVQDSTRATVHVL